MGDNNLPKLNKKLAEEFANRVSRKQYIKETPIMLPGQVKSFTGGIDYGRVKKELGPGTNIFHKGLQRRLGEEQSAWNKWGNFAMQVGAEIIGGTIEGIGYLGDVKGTVDMLNGDMDSFGNWVADIGVAMKEGSREHFPIFGAHDMGNLGFWLSNGVSVSSSLSLMIPAVGAVRGVSALGKAIGLAGKVGKNTVLGQILKLPLGQAVASRHMENFMEARQTWDTTRQIMFDSRKKDGSRYSLEEADYAAAEAASTLYKVNYTLLAQDVFQYALLGRGPKASMEITNRRLAKAAGQGLSETMRRTAFPYLKDAISEGAEEAAQFVFSEESRYRALLNAGAIEEKDVSERLKGYVQDREFWTNAMFGAIGSGVMQSVGAGLRRSNIPIFGGKKQQEFLEERIAHAKEAYSSMSEAAMDLNAAILNKDEAGIKAAENKIKFNIAYNAAALGNLDISTATVDAFVEAVEGSTEKDSYAPDLTKRMEGLKADMKTVGKLYEKNAKKYAASSVRDITQLQFDNLKSAEELKEVEKKISAAKRAYPRYNNLSSQGQELFDLMVEREALNESLVGSMVAQAIKLDKAETQEEQETIENQTKSFIEGINSQIKQVESRIKEIEKEQSDAISNENKGALVDNARNIAKRDIKILDGFVENSEEVVKERVKEVALNTTIDRNNEVLKLLTNKKVQDLTEEQEQKAREAAQKAAKEALEKDKKDKKKKREESVDNSKDEKIKKEEEEKKKKKEEAKKKKEEKPSTSLEDRIKALPTEELEELQRKAFAVNDVEGAKKMQDELDRRKKGESKEEEKIDEKVVEKSDLAETHDDEQPPMANNPVEFDEISGLPFDPVSDTGYSLAWLSTTMLDGVALAGQEDPELAQLITEYLENPEINLVGTHTVRFKIDQERINSYKELRPGTELDFYNAWKKYKKDGKINDAMLGQLPIVVELIGPDGKVVTLEDSNGNDRQLIIPIHDATFKNWEKLATVDLGDGYTKKDQAIDELLRIKRNILDNQDSENVAEVTEQRGGVPYNVEEYTAFLDALNLSSEDAVILSGSKAVNEEGKGEYLQHDKSTFNPFLAQGIGASATPGAFYAVVKRPNGEFFPVRLWTSKIGEAEATLIYNIYRKIASARKAEESLYDVAVSDKRLSDILNEIENSDDAKVSGLKDLIDADPNMTLSDLLSLLVYEGAVTKDAGKHRLLLGKKELKIGNKSFPIKSLTAETEDVHTHKDKIINELQKRLRQVSLKRVNDPIYKTYLSQAEIFTANFEPGENNFVQGTVVFGEISNTKPSKRPSKKKKPVTTDTTTEKKRVPDNQVIVKEEEFTITDDEGGKTVVKTQTMIDGSLKGESIQYDAEGNVVDGSFQAGINFGDSDILKRDGTTAEQAVKKVFVAEDLGNTLEKTGERPGSELMREKKISRLTEEQKTKAGISTTTDTTTEETLEEALGKRRTVSIAGISTRVKSDPDHTMSSMPEKKIEEATQKALTKFSNQVEEFLEKGTVNGKKIKGIETVTDLVKLLNKRSNPLQLWATNALDFVRDFLEAKAAGTETRTVEEFVTESDETIRSRFKTTTDTTTENIGKQITISNNRTVKIEETIPIYTGKDGYIIEVLHEGSKYVLAIYPDGDITDAAVIKEGLTENIKSNHPAIQFTKEDIAAIFSDAKTTTDTTTTTTKKGTINVYWGQAESSTSTKVLSNLAPRKFIWEGREYGSVEHAYQSNKSGTFDEDTYNKYLEGGSNNIKINKGKWTKDSPKENPDTAYIFTENINSIGSTRIGGGSAVIRNNPNAIGIVTKKYYTYKENRTSKNKDQWNQNFQDTDADFEIFKKVNLEQFDKIDNFDSIIFPDSFANSLASIPNRFALWLQNELQNRYGLITELNSKGTGLISKSISSTRNVKNAYGKKIRGKGTVAQMKAADSLGLMKQLVVESFKQNPNSEAAKKLMQYENFTHNTNQLIDQAFLEGLKLAQQELEKTTTTDTTTINPNIDLQLFEKIKALLVAKYPEIALTISAKPKWERANKNSIFNQNLDQILSDKYNKWDENNAAVSLTKEMQEANKNYAIVLDKNKMSINTTVNLLITKNPLEYVSVYPNGSVWLDTTKLANDVLKELGDTIIPQETKDEIKEFQDDLNNPEQYEERWIEYKNDLDSKIARIENTLEETKIENLEKKTASELFEIFVKTQTTEKGKSDIYRSFDLRQLDGKNIFHYNFKDGKLLDIYVRVPTKGGYTHEKVDPNDLGIDAQLALKEFKKDKNRITRAIDVMIAERLKDQLKYLKDGGEFAKSDYYQGKTEKERFIEEMIDFRREAIQFDESDIIELGLTTLIENNLIGNNIAIKGSGNGVRLAKPFGFKTNNLLELTRADEYKKIIDKKAKLNNILANKENFNNEYDQFELEDGDTLAPIPGWFLNAYSVEQTGKYFDEHTGIASGMIKGVLSMGAQQEYDNLYDYGVTPAFEILANTSDINSLLVDKIDYAKSTNLSNNFAILNQKDKNKIIGQANVKALTVLIDAVNQKQDTLPHEYAHHYINMWRDSPIVQEGIKRFGSEEALVEAIGKQAVEFVRTGKVGEALKWYQKFVKWILDKFTDQDVLDILTDAFLTRTELNKLEASKLATDVADTIEETPTLEIGRYVQDGEGNTYIIVAQTTGGKWKVYDPTSNTTKTSLPKDLTPSKFKGTIVPYQNSKYIVTAKGDIISLHTKRKLKYPATHPTAKAIRKKADEIRAEEKGIELIDVPVSKTVEEQVAEVKANIKKFKTKGKDGVIREIGEDDDFESYVLVDSKGNILHELARVSTFVTPEGVDKTKPLVSESLVIGTKADSLIRDFFEGELKEFGEYELTTGEEFDNFIQQLQGLKERFEKDGETVLASGILAYNTEMGAAGTLDLLTYDVDGNFRIYDIKTQRAKDGKGKNERINRYTGKTDYDSEFIDKDTKEVSKSDRQKHQEQLSMYKMMLEKTHGIKIEKIEIIPVLVDYNVGDSGTETLKLLENIPHEPLNKLFGFSTSSTNNAGKRASTQKGGKNVTKSSSKETQESKEAEFAARNLDKNTLESKSKLTDDQKKKNLKDLLGKKGGISKPASKKKRGGLSNKHGNEFTGSVDKIIDLEDSRSPITQAEINKVLSILPEDVKFEMVEDYINLLSGGRASVGLFKSGLITLSVKAKSGDAYHEAFHAVFRSALSDKQRTELLEEAKEVFLAPLESDIKFLQDRHNLSREEAIDLYYEEQLADEFGIYSQDPSNYTNKEGKTKNRGFFKRLLEWIKNIIYKPNNYKTLFGNILDGNFSGGRNVDVFIQNNTINSIDNITKKPCY
jgi:hypothetical protein